MRTKRSNMSTEEKSEERGKNAKIILNYPLTNLFTFFLARRVLIEIATQLSFKRFKVFFTWTIPVNHVYDLRALTI